MSLTNIIPLGVVLSTGLIAIITYSFQKYLDRRNDLVALKRKKYMVFLEVFVSPSLTNDKKEWLQYHVLANEFPLYASDDVIKSFAKFQEYCGKTAGMGTRDETTYKNLFSELLMSMRKDCFDKVTLTNEELVAQLTFSV